MDEKNSNQSKQSSAQGGRRPGAGRKKGQPNRRTVEVQAATAESGQTPLDYMLSVMRSDSSDPRTRLAAAQAAAPYVHAKLSSVELTGKDGGPLETKTTIDPTKLSDAALREIMAARA